MHLQTTHGIKAALLVPFGITAVLLSLAQPSAGTELEPGEPAARSDSSRIFDVSKKSGGAVTVTLTPKRLRDEKLEVAVRIDTHTVNDLHKYDLMKMTSLVHDGKRVAAASAPKLEGHHSSGELVFPLRILPKAFSIEIRGLDEPALRVLSWP